jgi:hypothetical protein
MNQIPATRREMVPDTVFLPEYLEVFDIRS